MAQLGDQLGQVVRERDSLGESLLLGADVAQLGFERGHIGIALRHLRLDLVADLREHLIEQLLGRHVASDVVDQRCLYFAHGLLHGHRAHDVAALMMTRARVVLHALVTAAIGERSRRQDRATAMRTLTESGERVPTRRTTPRVRHLLARAEALLHGEPRLVVNDPPFRNLDHDRLLRVGLHATSGPAVPDLLDAAVDVNAAIARVEQHRADGRRRPRPAAAATCSGWRNALFIEAMRDRLQADIGEIHLEDAADDLSLLLVHARNGVLAARPIALALERVAEAAPARDAALANARSKRLAYARADRLQLHLMTGAGDERGRLVDGVRELHLLAVRVIEEPAAAIANEVAHDERHFDRVTSKARLVSADDDVATLRVCEQAAEPGAAQEVIARAPIV